MSEQELRELDKWIAERVMGYEERQSYRGSSRINGETFWVVAGRAATSPAFKGQHRFPEFSTDPAAAMQVLEKCAAKCTVTVEFGRNQLGNNQFMVARLSDHGGNCTEDYCKCATTLPLAICLLAKKLFTAA